MKEKLYQLIQKLRGFLELHYKKYSTYLPYIIAVISSTAIVVGGINLFVELTEELKNEVLTAYDTSITDYIISYRSPNLTNFFVFITHVGDVYGYLIILGLGVLLSAVVYKNWKYVSQITIVLFLATISNMVLKRFVDRARPGIEHLVSVETLSYPSGHAMSAMAFYGFLIYLCSKLKMVRLFKIPLIILLVALILSIGISRIYLGVHFPSDIAGGFIAGFIWVIFCIMIFNLIDIFRRDPKT
ncbi:phosphatase PAP2 family protein [uncultured Zobellia sp.]|uniref:phosphatase PAP2 family protein n=1 Tax=uncultured Zobellia sp. TaxID=255433 RepID=UPI002593AD34|nr:phosphatase PAP2 family protein [uncultured Zobellia sp.]